MEGAVELFSSFIPQVTEVDTSGGNITTKKRFSAGSLVAMILFGLIGAAIGAIL